MTPADFPLVRWRHGALMTIVVAFGQQGWRKWGFFSGLWPSASCALLY